MELEPANWKPLELRIGRRCAEFMWMWRENGLEHYKHIDTPRYLILDAEGRSYVPAGMTSWYALISGKNSAGLWRQSVSEVSIESIATAGAVLAFLLAAAAGITSRRGIQLIVIGVLFSWLPLVSEVGARGLPVREGVMNEMT